MIRVKIKNKATQEYTHGAQFLNQTEADAWIAKQKAKGANCAWGRPAYTEQIPQLDEAGDPVLDETGLPVYTEVQHEDEFVVEMTDITEEVQKQAIKNSVSKARSFGNSLLDEFAAENITLGITQDNLTGQVLDTMQPVMTALMAGSLYEAIARAKAVDPASYDSKYVTAARLLEYVNKIEDYLNIPLSTEL